MSEWFFWSVGVFVIGLLILFVVCAFGYGLWAAFMDWMTQRRIKRDEIPMWYRQTSFTYPYIYEPRFYSETMTEMNERKTTHVE